MQTYLCGCKNIDSSFTFCSTHALDPRRDEINRFWWSKYTPAEWANYKKDLEIGLELEPIKEDDESHPCVFGGCTSTVPYDDEPYCFDHSSDSGSTVPGYSYKAAASR